MRISEIRRISKWPQAERLYRALSAMFDEEGYPVTLAETEDAPGHWQVSAIVPDHEVDRAIAGTADISPDNENDFIVAAVPDLDWVAHALAGLAPVVAGRYFVHGSHHRHRAATNQIAIEIDAGQAFGTGHHETTAGCLGLLSGLGKRVKFTKVADVGTGSGVLAIAAAKSSRCRVLATDIDPIACRVARENARLNGCGGPVTVVVTAGAQHRLFAERGPFDLLFANILARPLELMATDLGRLVKPGGHMILSGILQHQRARILSAYRNCGLVLSHEHCANGWVSLCLRQVAVLSSSA